MAARRLTSASSRSSEMTVAASLPEAQPWPAPGKPWSENDLEGVISDLYTVRLFGRAAEDERRKYAGQIPLAWLAERLSRHDLPGTPLFRHFMSVMRRPEEHETRGSRPELGWGHFHLIADWVRGQGDVLVGDVYEFHPWVHTLRKRRDESVRPAWLLLGHRPRSPGVIPDLEPLRSSKSRDPFDMAVTFDTAMHNGAVFGRFCDLYAAVVSGALPVGAYRARLVTVGLDDRLLNDMRFQYDGWGPAAYCRDLEVT